MPRFEPHPVRRPVLIAGASSGIGSATAEMLAEQGYPVALGARRVEECERLAEKITAAGGAAFAHYLDVTDTASVDEFVFAAERALGPAEIVVSGAGDLEFGLIHEMSSEQFAKQVDVHLIGAHRLVRRVIPDMITRGRGDFVLISSDCADAPRPRAGAYSAAKTGLEAMANQMRMELEGTGVRVSLVRPGATKTGMGLTAPAEVVGPLIEDWIAWGFARHPYMLRPRDMAAAVSSVVSTPPGSHLVLVEVQPGVPKKVAESGSGA
ncbi:SDR family oxidoreductase [Nocardia sp. NBC_00565]|uniref:SDR family oxidoreductase n=1 Tax=Nocardia sp. NBC_00565 TaxID=2975993 RepID=UPI002E81D65F|nr:SDR family oxidoreductase [Nocardia sp. NBC_00565]WUC04686.1 SDR family oxidoreductase [Nocardia sp. NBC_00565]